MSLTDTASLHQRIRADIEARILGGDWPPGHRLPVEAELMTQYGCSRMTVNKAVSALADAGLIVRRRRAGSFVARPRIHSAVLDIPDIQSEITARGEAYAFRLLSVRRRAPARGDADEAELAGGGALLALRGAHLASGRPFALEERLISLRAAPAAAEADFALVSPGAWLLEHVAWTEAENRISAINADGPVAEALALDPGAACLVVRRRTWRAGERITNVRLVFPGEAYELVARFGPGQA
ncbi:MAG: histidine utilization repressor [Caulobacteraceae bacterium]|nr:histidine utilization repressor [Caulobacteraceae bacterium]